MTTTIANPATTQKKMTGKEIVDLARRHTLYEWSAQSKVGVRGAQLCKTSKAGAASYVAVWARNIRDGPAPDLFG